jgi:hypothetical protein
MWKQRRIVTYLDGLPPIGHLRQARDAEQEFVKCDIDSRGALMARVVYKLYRLSEDKIETADGRA